MSGRIGYHNGKKSFPADIDWSSHGIETSPQPPTGKNGDPIEGATVQDYFGSEQMVTDNFFIRAGAAAMRLRHAYDSTCYGDPRMEYLLRGQVYPISYVRDSTPAA